MEYAGKKIAVIGLGLEGIPVTRHLVSKGAVVTVHDYKHPEELAAKTEMLSGLPVQFRLGDQ